MSTRKYASEYEKLKKRKKKKRLYSNQHINGLDLFSELKVLKEILQIKDYTPIDIINYIKRLDSFLNTCIAYKILLTIPLRSTMSQERLSGLAILLIEKEMLEEDEYKNLISQFASQKARKIDFR